MAPRIQSLKALEIFDSRGNPTVKTYLTLDDGSVHTASVPSGASTGHYEAFERRDGDRERYLGKGVLGVCKSIETEIHQHLKGMEVTKQSDIDRKLIDLDGTPNKERLGANALLSVSIALVRAGAYASGLELYKYIAHLCGCRVSVLPRPMCNVINGGAHADNALDFQEFMIVPIKAISFSDRLRMCAEIFQHLRRRLKEKGYTTNVGDEGGFAPNLSLEKENPFDLIEQAGKQAGYESGIDFAFAMDVAATEFQNESSGRYHLTGRKQELSAPELIDIYEDLMNAYPIISIEDGIGEFDYEGWSELYARLGDRIQIVGDDLYATNCDRLKMGIEYGLSNAILIKPNQIGTVTETFETIKLAKEHDFKCIISHRSGETEDTFIADLAVGTGVGQIKTGSLCRTDRMAKYNRLIEIDHLITG